MPVDGITLRRADGDLEVVESMLDRADLPATDLSSRPARFYVGFRDGDRVGCGGVAVYGADGLLRSVVVEPAARGESVGSALCDALEDRARAAGVETLSLLTATAAGFFAARGYEVVDRDAASAAIRRTPQFTDRCPDSATCMRRSLSVGRDGDPDC